MSHQDLAQSPQEAAKAQARDPLALFCRWENFRLASQLPHPDPRVLEAWQAFAASLSAREMVTLGVMRRDQARRVAKWRAAA